MIPKRRKRAKMLVRAPERVRSRLHLQWVRGHECLAAASNACDGRMESHHVRVKGQGTTGKKPGDDKAVPLCFRHHAIGHAIGWDSFEAEHHLNMTASAAELWQRSPHGIKYRREHDRD